MALPDYARLTIGTPLIIADSTYLPTGNNSLGGTIDYDLDLTSKLNGEAEQSGRIDFTANIDLEYVLAAALEFAAAPTAGETYDFYMAWGANASAVGWPAGIAGGTASAAFTGYSSNLDEALKQLQFLGSMVLTVQATTTVQIDTNISTFTPRARYGVLVAYNACATADTHSDAVEMAVRLTPLVTQVQD